MELKRALPPRVGTLSAFDTFAVLGGFRTLAADCAWIALQSAWERRESEASEALVRTATRLDPETLFFWRNGARIVAFDISLWRIAAGGGGRHVPAIRRQQIYQEQAAAALQLLHEALAARPGSAALWLERAGIELHAARDVAAAAASFRRGWELDPSLTFAARMQAQLLLRLGRREEARAALTQLHRYLAAGPDPAGLARVETRIAELDREIAVEAEKSSPPAN